LHRRHAQARARDLAQELLEARRTRMLGEQRMSAHAKHTPYFFHRAVPLVVAELPAIQAVARREEIVGRRREWKCHGAAGNEAHGSASTVDGPTVTVANASSRLCDRRGRD